MAEVYCYNKGCNKKFRLDENREDACQYHPGEPVFHDALKGWSCCNKKSTDFTTFLSIPGCSRSWHSNQKPPEPEKPVRDDKKLDEEIAKAAHPAPVKPIELTKRPVGDELVELRRTIAPSLNVNLSKANEANVNGAILDANGQVPVGTPCKNATCKATYLNESSDRESCTHHPGVAIFHEGMKYWSCCQRKTSDFDNFLNQAGCTQAKHLWFKKETNQEKVDCRYDFFQTGGFVELTIYSKNPIPDKTSIKASAVNLDINISFENGTKNFSKNIELFGVVKLEESVVNFYQTKVGIKLKKADPISWSKLEYIHPAPAAQE